MTENDLREVLRDFVSKFEFKYQAAKPLCISESVLYNMLLGKAPVSYRVAKALGYRVVRRFEAIR